MIAQPLPHCGHTLLTPAIQGSERSAHLRLVARLFQVAVDDVLGDSQLLGPLHITRGRAAAVAHEGGLRVFLVQSGRLDNRLQSSDGVCTGRVQPFKPFKPDP